jgi:hypothetical protein
MSTPTERNTMIATLYTTIGTENYTDTFDSHDMARQAYEATVVAATDNPEIRGAVLDLGGAKVVIWNADDGSMNLNTPTERNTMSLKDQYLNQYGNRIDAAAALASDLMEGDAATFKAGYSADNAAIAAAEVFGLSGTEKLDVRAIIGRANPTTPPLGSDELQARYNEARQEFWHGKSNPTTPTDNQDSIDAAIAAEEERLATYPDRLEGAL